MANQEQLEILKKGVRVWNQWRRTHLETMIDLSGADLIERDLSAANLQGANLNKAKICRADLGVANLMEANLSGANLNGAYLSEVDLRKANLNNAYLIKADLNRADLYRATLRGAYLKYANLNNVNLDESDLSNVGFANVYINKTNLRKANLKGANLSEANICNADLSESNFLKAILSFTIFGKIDLSNLVGLEKAIHLGPSTLGIDTIAKSKGKIPEDFLRGCGLSDFEIESAKLYDPELSNEDKNNILYKMYDLRATQSLQISPLFISYSHSDGTFVDKLEGHLNKRGIRFWRDVHDMKSGRIETQIDRAIRQNPTVLLILSENSLKSDWVEHEVRTARELEKEMSRDVLCPVALDDSWKSSPWPRRVMEQVMEYNILDFSNWMDDSQFGSTCNKLIDGLELFYKGGS